MSEWDPKLAQIRGEAIGPRPLTRKSPWRTEIRDRNMTRRRVLLPRKEHPDYEALRLSAEKDGIDVVEPGASLGVTFDFTEELKELVLEKYDITLVRE